MININYTITDDRRQLILSVDSEDQKSLNDLKEEDPDYWATQNCEFDVLDHLFSNSELGWASPSDWGDLTDAPMIGIYDFPEEGDPVLLERWAFMSYCLRSFLDDLAGEGRAVFVDRN